MKHLVEANRSPSISTVDVKLCPYIKEVDNNYEIKIDVYLWVQINFQLSAQTWGIR